MDGYLSWIAQWLEHQHVKLETRVQTPVQDMLFLNFYKVLFVFSQVGRHGMLSFPQSVIKFLKIRRKYLNYYKLQFMV